MPRTPLNAYSIQWLALYDAWVSFTRDAAAVGISSSYKAMKNFLSVHRATLMELGVIAKGSNGRVLAHRDFFSPAAFALLIGRAPAEAIEQQRHALAQKAQRRTRRVAHAPAEADAV